MADIVNSGGELVFDVPPISFNQIDHSKKDANQQAYWRCVDKNNRQQKVRPNSPKIVPILRKYFDRTGAAKQEFVFKEVQEENCYQQNFFDYWTLFQKCLHNNVVR